MKRVSVGDDGNTPVLATDIQPTTAADRTNTAAVIVQRNQ